MARIGTARALELLQQVAAEHNLTTLAITGKCRVARIAAARKAFCAAAVAEKITLQVVADILCCDYSTVSYHASPSMKDRKRWEQRRAAEKRV